LSTVDLSMCSITENIYYPQLSSVAILLQPEPVSHRITQGKHCVLSLSVLPSCRLPLPPTCLLLTANEARSYFASTILIVSYSTVNLTIGWQHVCVSVCVCVCVCECVCECKRRKGREEARDGGQTAYALTAPFTFEFKIEVSWHLISGLEKCVTNKEGNISVRLFCIGCTMCHVMMLNKVYINRRLYWHTSQ
jgi:hypothetical protein